MFPITIYDKKNTGLSKKLIVKGLDYELPPGIDIYQFEATSVPELTAKKNYNNGKFLQFIVDRKCYCFYCGEESYDYVSSYFHDGSGINLWLLDDLRSNAIICKTCRSHAGKERLKYRKKPKNEKKNDLYSLLKYEPEVLLPTIEPVDLHFSYRDNGTLSPKSFRAARTIDVFSLNRTELVERRLRAMKLIESKGFDKRYYLDVGGEIAPLDVIFCLLSKGLGDEFGNEFARTKNQGDRIVSTQDEYYKRRISSSEDFKYKSKVFKSIDKKVKINRVYTSFVGLSEVVFNKVRVFESNQVIKFSGKDSILILGENGVGKSTAIEIIERSVKPRAKLNLASFVGSLDKTEPKPFVSIRYAGVGKKLHFSLEKNQVGRRELCNVVRVPEGRISNNLINKFQSWVLDNSEDREFVDWIARKLKILLDLPNAYYFYSDSHICYWIAEKGTSERKYLSEFSSGYRSLMTAFYLIIYKLYSYVTDSIYTLETALSSTIILIDEIELHLHPRLKMKVVGALQRVFPESLFIISTHDPLVIKSANDRTKILLFKENESGKTEIIDDLPSHQYLNTEQILTSPFFGLDATSLDDKTDAWALYHAALNEGDREQASVYREKLAGSGLFGSTYREYLAFSAVDAYLAKKEIPRVDDVADLIDRIENGDA